MPKKDITVMEEAGEIPGFTVYMRLLPYLKPFIFPFALSIFGFIIFAASNPMLAKLMEMIIQALEQKNADARWVLPLVAVGIFFLRGVGTFLGTYFNAYVSNRLVMNMRLEVFSHLITLPVSYFNTYSDGIIMQRMSGGLGLISSALTGALKILIREGLTVVFLLAYAFYLNWKLSLTFLLVAPFIALVVRYTTRRFRDITRKNEAIMGGLLQIAKEMISGHEVMRSFSGHDYEKKRYGKAAELNFKQKMKIRKIESLSTPVLQLLISIAMAMIIFLLLQPETLMQNSTGELIGYLTAIALLPKSLRQLSGVNADIQRGIAGAQIVFRLLDTAPEPDEGTHEVEKVNGHIAVENVKFRYNETQDYVLDDISFSIQPGQMVALVGKSGSGKSTLATLLQRFYDVSEGRILIDGIDIRDYKLKSLRKQIAVVSQNLILFNDTIRHNIAYGAMESADDQQIIEAAQKANALEFIQSLPKGLDTLIGDNGLQLSGGQRQRIAIARAFLKSSPILILDEATSALDNESEQEIQRALEQVIKGRTTLVIAHRLSTIENADTILVMKKGKIVEQGTHKELLKNKGHYSALYTSMQEGEVV